MKMFQYSVIGVMVLLLAVALVLVMRGERQAPRPAPETLTVAATIHPLYDIVRNVAGDDAAVVRVLPPGASPHTYDFSPRDLNRLAEAEVLFAIGHELDNWAFSATPAEPVVVDRGIEVRDGDPHYWLDIEHAVRITETVADELAERDPANAEDYRQRAAAYGEALEQTGRELDARIAPFSGLGIVTFHDAWEYFTRSFDLEIVGTFEGEGGKQPAAHTLARLRTAIDEHDVRVIFSEPQLGGASVAAFAENNGLGIAELDPIGGVEGRETYIELMEYNVAQVIRALE